MPTSADESTVRKYRPAQPDSRRPVSTDLKGATVRKGTIKRPSGAQEPIIRLVGNANPQGILDSPGIDAETGEVIGTYIEPGTQDDINIWWEIFTEIGRETVEIQRRERRQNRLQRGHRQHGNQN